MEIALTCVCGQKVFVRPSDRGLKLMCPACRVTITVPQNIAVSDDQSEWVILDTETDGLEPPIHVLEIAAQRMRGRLKVGDAFRVFLNHQIPIPAAATAIHGYTEDFLATCGVPPREAHQRLRSYIENRYIVAHYLRYDWNAVLIPEWERLRETPIGRRGYCTWNLSKRAIPECNSHRLDALREAFAFPTSEAHSAIGDIDSVYRLLTDIIFPRLETVGFSTYLECAEFSTTTPVLKCRCLVQGKNYLDEVRKNREARQDAAARENLIESIRIGSVPDVPSLLCNRGFITQEPDIEFAGRTFLFTGKMVWGSRSNATRLIESVGGMVSTSKTITSTIDYLILGEDKEKGWSALLHGGKLVDAVCHKIADDRCRLCIILESDLIDSLMARLEARSNPAPAVLPQPTASSRAPLT